MYSKKKHSAKCDATWLLSLGTNDREALEMGGDCGEQKRELPSAL